MGLIEKPVELRAAGEVEKTILEYVGRMTGDESVSVARMVSPAGWSEPGQTPGFREISLVLSGTLVAETADGTVAVRAGQAFVSEKDDWVRFSTPEGPAEYVAICLPAFAPDIVHRDPQ